MMGNILNFLKENYKVIMGTILVYQIILTIFSFSIVNLVILAVLIVVIAGTVLIYTYKDTFKNWFTK
jgi:uncharacterized membrane protein YraQ (UPF0718 family)